MASPAPVFVNVRDFGAVPGPAGRLTCSDAFQKAVDALDENAGGVVFVPAAPQPYEFVRSVMVDRNRVRIVGEDRRASALQAIGATPPLTFGLRRITHGQPLSDGHWADLSGMLDASVTDQRWGCRTRVPSPVAGGPTSEATVTLPCSPFQFGPTDGAYWSGVRQLTVDLVVRNDAMPWSVQPLFGMVDAFRAPSPFYAYVNAHETPPAVVFVFRTTDGLHREIRIPFDPAQPVLRCSFQLDLDARTVTAWTNRRQATQRVQVQPDLSLVNDDWTPQEPGKDLAFVPNWYAPFRLAAIGPNSSGRAGLPGSENNPVDLTFGALRFSDTLRYRVLAEGQEQEDTNGKVNDRRCLTVEPGAFGALTMREPVHKSAAGVPDLQILWEGDGGSFGRAFFVPDQLVEYVEGNGCEKLNIKGFSFAPNPTHYGQAIGLGLVYSFSLDDMVVEFGAQGLSSHHFGANYPVSLASCRFEHQTDCAIYGFFQNTTADNLALGYYGRSAFKALRSRVTYGNVSCSDSAVCESAVKLFQTEAVLDNWLIDFEDFGADLPRDSYIWASLADDIGGPTQLTVRDCVGSAGGEHAVAIRLVSNERGALPDSHKGAGWCKAERSFNHHADPRMPALIAVDGPLWQGLYEGLPPAGKALVINTATPGASARIGIGAVPPPASAPPLLAPPDDPLPKLPGLIGYYRADALRDTHGSPLRDGALVTEFTDLSPARSHGTPAGGAAVFETGAVNGLAALRFTGGVYEFPALRGTTGAATWFFVAKRLPTFDSAPGRPGSLRSYGQGWQLDFLLMSRTAESDNDWAVYAVRSTAGPARKLRTFVNGYPYELRRDDRVRTVGWSTPVLGYRADHGHALQGLVAAAVVCDSALSDQDVADTCRYLLHRHQIPV
ncbi:hypothetical protein ACIRU3_42650 [Streptomyces sp. NPDC101151]|uniref:hypothetical protein n=1 Tax=Streptomyces sp. NPDC101151 TaxID=3366115 RepID=UPI00382957CF